ncbi:unnamed protein product, partial [Amoebophrya sp. A25]
LEDNIEIDDLAPLPAPDAPDGLILGLNMDPVALDHPANADAQPLQDAAAGDVVEDDSDSSDKKKIKKLLAAVEKATENEDGLAHYFSIHEMPFTWHQTHLRVTYGKQYDEEQDARTAAFLKEWPQLQTDKGFHSFLISCAIIFPQFLRTTIYNCFDQMHNVDEMKRVWRYVTLATRHLVYELCDPCCNLWITIVLRGALTPDFAQRYPGLWDLRKRTEFCEFMRTLLPDDFEKAKKILTNIIISGPTSDSEAESPWAWVTAADGRLLMLAGKFKLSYAVLSWASSTVLFEDVPQLGDKYEHLVADIDRIRNSLETSQSEGEFLKVLQEKSKSEKSWTQLFKKVEDMRVSAERSAETSDFIRKAVAESKDKEMCVHSTNYHEPSMEVMCYKKAADRIEADDFHKTCRLGGVADDTWRFRHWNKEGKPLVVWDTEHDFWVWVTDLLRGKYMGWKMRQCTDTKRLSLRMRRNVSSLMCGFTVNCWVLMDYNSVQFIDGICAIPYRGNMLTTIDIMKQCISAIPEDLLNHAIYWLTSVRLAEQPKIPEKYRRRALQRIVDEEKDTTKSVMRILDEE